MPELGPDRYIPLPIDPPVPMLIGSAASAHDTSDVGAGEEVGKRSRTFGASRRQLPLDRVEYGRDGLTIIPTPSVGGSEVSFNLLNTSSCLGDPNATGVGVVPEASDKSF